MKHRCSTLPVTATRGVSARPGAASREFRVVEAGAVALYRGMGTPFGAGALTPRMHFAPSGTTTWSPPV